MATARSPSLWIATATCSQRSTTRSPPGLTRGSEPPPPTSLACVWHARKPVKLKMASDLVGAAGLEPTACWL